MNSLFSIYIKVSKELKNDLEILVGQTVFKLQIKGDQYCTNDLACVHFDANVDFLGQVYNVIMPVVDFKEVLIAFRCITKYA